MLSYVGAGLLSVRPRVYEEGSPRAKGQAVLDNLLSVYFLVDLIPVVPFEIIFKNDSWRLVRCVKTMRIIPYFSSWQRTTKLNRAVLRLLKQTIFLLLVMHWLSCESLVLCAPPF